MKKKENFSQTCKLCGRTFTSPDKWINHTFISNPVAILNDIAKFKKLKSKTQVEDLLIKIFFDDIIQIDLDSDLRGMNIMPINERRSVAKCYMNALYNGFDSPKHKKSVRNAEFATHIETALQTNKIHFWHNNAVEKIMRIKWNQFKAGLKRMGIQVLFDFGYS